MTVIQSSFTVLPILLFGIFKGEKTTTEEHRNVLSDILLVNNVSPTSRAARGEYSVCIAGNVLKQLSFFILTEEFPFKIHSCKLPFQTLWVFSFFSAQHTCQKISFCELDFNNCICGKR